MARPSARKPYTRDQMPLEIERHRQLYTLQGFLVHKKHPPPQDHHGSLGIGPTVGSYGGAVSRERGTPVDPRSSAPPTPPMNTKPISCSCAETTEQEATEQNPAHTCREPRKTLLMHGPAGVGVALLLYMYIQTYIYIYVYKYIHIYIIIYIYRYNYAYNDTCNYIHNH